MRTKYLFAFFAVVAALLLPCAAHAQCVQFYCESFGTYDPSSNLIWGYSLYSGYEGGWAQLWVDSYVSDPNGNYTYEGSSMGYFDVWVSFYYTPAQSGIYGVWGYNFYQIEGWWEYDGTSEYDVWVPPPPVITSCPAPSWGVGPNYATIWGSGFSGTYPSISWSGNGGVDFLQSDSSAWVVSDSQINVYADLTALSWPGSVAIGVGPAACVIAVAALPPPPPPPLVTIACPPGIPVGGSNTCSAVGPSGTTIMLRLNRTTENGGYATFDNGASATEITLSSQTATPITINGVATSSTANDITLNAYDVLWDNPGSQSLSVVSVSISLNPVDPPIQKDTQLATFQAYVLGPGTAPGLGLGGEIYYNGTQEPSECVVGVELVGTVTPSNYQGPVTLQRNIVSDATFLGQTPYYNDPGLKPPGPDNSPGGYVDTSVGNGGPSEVFDLDAPGVGPGPFANTPKRFRTNFQEQAVLGGLGDDNPPNVGAPFPYYVAVSCGGVSGAPTLDYSATPSDNVAYPGTVPLTWNLQ